MYRVTMAVRDYILLNLFLNFLNLAQLRCNLCLILTRPSKIGKPVDKPKQIQQILFPWPSHPVQRHRNNGHIKAYKMSQISL